MVQHTPLGNVLNGINEFQVVHALITQSLKGEDNEKAGQDTSDGLEKNNSQNNLVTALCQTFNSFNSSNHKRIFPKLVKEFISRVRKSQERSCSSVSCSSSSRSSVCSDMRVPPARKQSCVVRYASVLKSSNGEAAEKIAPKSITSSSNVHDKVLQFEKQANLVRSPGETPTRTPDSPHNCRAAQSSNNCDGPHLEQRHNDIEITEAPASEQIAPTSHNPSAPDISPEPLDSSGTLPHNPHSLDNLQAPADPCPAPRESRSLKRVPSERFQKMRRKVQRLMSRRSDDESRPVVAVDPANEDEFLRSIRIPDPMHRAPSIILCMPDHVLCHIFSHLDTRTLASLKCACSDFNFLINNFDIRATDSRWTKDYRYLSDPCVQCRHIFVRGDMSMCRFHPKRYYSDLPYGRSYWMCCLQYDKSAPGCRTGLHDNHWNKMT